MARGEQGGLFLEVAIVAIFDLLYLGQHHLQHLFLGGGLVVCSQHLFLKGGEVAFLGFC